MGLDGANILMEVEDEFGITIDDDEAFAEGDVTVGDLYRCIIGMLRAKGEMLGPDAPAKCLSSAAFYVFRRGLCDECGLDRKRIRPSTRLDEVVPKAGRRRRWRALGERLGLELPDLKLHPLLERAISCLAIFIACAGLVVAPFTEWPDLVILAFLGAGPAFAITAFLLTRPLGVHFPHTTQTVRGMVLRVLATNLKKITGVSRPEAAKRRLHPDEVWEMLRSIVVQELDVAPEEVTKQARFVKDLGVG